MAEPGANFEYHCGRGYIWFFVQTQIRLLELCPELVKTLLYIAACAIVVRLCVKSVGKILGVADEVPPEKFWKQISGRRRSSAGKF